MLKGLEVGECDSLPFLMDNSKQDYIKYFKEEGDVGFNPDHNKKVVEDSIKKYEAERARRQKDFTDQIGERAHAVTSYLMHLQRGNKSTPIEKYFSKTYLAHLRGKKIVEKMQLVKNKGSFYQPDNKIISLSSIN